MNRYRCALLFFALTISTLLVAEKDEKLEQKIHAALEKNSYSAIDSLLKKNASAVQKINVHHLNYDLLYAFRANNSIRTKKYGMSQKNFLRTAFFIESKLPDFVENKKYYITKSKSGLSNNLEYDPLTKNVFIILDGKKARVGKGKKKTVTKAISYNGADPRIVARGEQSSSMKREFALTKQLQNTPGLFQTYGFGTHKAHGKKYTTIYSKLYKPGSLQGVFDKGMKFSVYEKIKIAHDILHGLHMIHQKGLVHRDLGARNYLINVPRGKIGKRKVQACIADFGRMNYIKNVRDTKVQGNTSYTAPEGLFRWKLKKEQYFKTDVFAVGCVLYRLVYNKTRAPWQKFSYVKDSRPVKKRYREMVHKILKATESRRRALAKKKERSLKEELESIMLNMTHPYPEKRKSAQVQFERIDKLLTRLQTS